jgi:hypothetical protein
MLQIISNGCVGVRDEVRRKVTREHEKELSRRRARWLARRFSPHWARGTWQRAGTDMVSRSSDTAEEFIMYASKHISQLATPKVQSDLERASTQCTAQNLILDVIDVIDTTACHTRSVTVQSLPT